MDSSTLTPVIPAQPKREDRSERYSEVEPHLYPLSATVYAKVRQDIQQYGLNAEQAEQLRSALGAFPQPFQEAEIARQLDWILDARRPSYEPLSPETILAAAQCVDAGQTSFLSQEME